MAERSMDNARASTSRSADIDALQASDILCKMYHHLLGRPPDDAVRGWLADRLAVGQSGLSILADLMQAPEYAPPVSEEFLPSGLIKENNLGEALTALSEAHVRFFGRRPDDAGLAWMEERLRLGQSGLSLISDLMKTPEYQVWSRNPLFVPPGHFYSPITNAQEVEVAITAASLIETHHELHGIRLDRAAMLELWRSIATLARNEAAPHRRYHPDNPHFAATDAFVWSGMLRHLKPRQVIEVGSGWSSALLLDTIDEYFEHKVELTFIEPHPALLKGRIGTHPEIRIIETGVQSCDLSIFEGLDSGDVLFIDSTHIMKTGSDVTHELFEVLPRLKSGVYVHFHDVFWPFEYPRTWSLEENRSWNELYALRAFLTENTSWQIVMFNDYLAKTAPNKVLEHYSDFKGTLGGSLYLRKV